jgi:hypothetical protein
MRRSRRPGASSTSCRAFSSPTSRRARGPRRDAVPHGNRRAGGQQSDGADRSRARAGAGPHVQGRGQDLCDETGGRCLREGQQHRSDHRSTGATSRNRQDHGRRAVRRAYPAGRVCDSGQRLGNRRAARREHAGGARAVPARAAAKPDRPATGAVWRAGDSRDRTRRRRPARRRRTAGAQVNQALGDRGAAQAGAALAGGQAWQNAGAGIIQTLSGLAQPVTAGGGLFQRWAF